MKNGHNIFLILGIVLILVILVSTGCEKHDFNDKNDNSDSRVITKECHRDEDCMKTGCSGTVCQSVNKEKRFTTCEWKEEYECYKDAECGCVDGRCVWKDPGIEDCIEKKTKGKNSSEVVY